MKTRMKKEIISCDICKATGATTVWFTVDRRMDRAGSMDDVEESVDLCPKHQWSAYKLAEQLLSYEKRSLVVSHLRAGLTRITKDSLHKGQS